MVLQSDPTKVRRAKAGERVAVAQCSRGRRLFVSPKDPNVKVHMPAGTRLRFTERIHCMGAIIGGMKGPSGYERNRTVTVGYARDRGLPRSPVRPALQMTKRRALLLQYVYSGQTADVLEVPQR